MSEEVAQTFQISPHRTWNPRGYHGHIALANGQINPQAMVCRATESVEFQIVLPRVANDVHLTTPTAKLRISWFTDLTDVTNAVKFYAKLVSIAAGGSLDPSAASFTAALDGSGTGISSGRGLLNIIDVAIPDALAVRGNTLLGTVRRNDGDAADTLAGTIGIFSVEFIADKA